MKKWTLSEEQKLRLTKLLGVTNTLEILSVAQTPCDIYRLNHIPFPIKMNFSECLLKWNNGEAIGKCESGYSTALFTAHGKHFLPSPGTYASLQFLDISQKVLVIEQLDSSLMLSLPTKFIERRQHPRFHNNGIAILKIGGKHIQTQVKDLSANGLGVESTVLVELGTKVDILLRLEGKKHLPIECSGIVVSERRPSQTINGHRLIGIQLLEFANEFKDEITKLTDFKQQEPN